MNIRLLVSWLYSIYVYNETSRGISTERGEIYIYLSTLMVEYPQNTIDTNTQPKFSQVLTNIAKGLEVGCISKHLWELTVDYPVFSVVMAIYRYVEII